MHPSESIAEEQGTEKPEEPNAALRRTFGIDIRSLAALRVGLGVLLLVDLAGRAPYLSAHYSDFGILPRHAVTGLSFHSLGGGAAWTGFLFVVAAVFALMLLAGYRTFLATLASWLLLISLHIRNPYLIDSGDKLLALLLLWGIFLPLGACASVDARMSGSARRGPRVVLSPATFGLLFQVAFVYLFSALLKDTRIWLAEGSAIYYALNIDLVTTRLGRSLLEFPGLLRIATRASFLLELLGPFLAFVPVGTAFFRTAIPAVFCAFHLSHVATMEIGLFPYVCMAAWLSFLPPELWDGLGRSRIGKALLRPGKGFLDRVSIAAERLSRGRSRLAHGLFEPRFARPADILAGILLAYIFVWNLGTVSALLEMPPILSRVGEQLCIRQRWAMFASPLRKDGWWVMPARLRDKSEVDLHTGASPVRWVKPELVSEVFTSPRIWKWLTFAWSAQDRDKIAHYAAWLRRDWDARHEESRRIETLQIHFMLEETRPDYQPPLPLDVLIYEWNGPGNERVVSYDEGLRSARPIPPDSGSLPASGRR